LLVLQRFYCVAIVCPGRISMIVGYLRRRPFERKAIATNQRIDLLAAGAERVVSERAGMSDDRPVLERTVACLGSGDILITVGLAHIAYSRAHLLDLISRLQAKGTALRSLQEGLDTSAPGGRHGVEETLDQLRRNLLLEMQ